MVYFSSDLSEVKRLAQELESSGIGCEVRKEVMMDGALVHLPEAELWIQKDRDSHRAFLLCVERNTGFARREMRGFAPDTLSEGLAA